VTNTKVKYRVERALPAQVEGELMRLWAQNLPFAGAVEKKLRWAYRDAPEPPLSVFLLLAASDGGTAAVGTAGVMTRHFRLGDRRVRAALHADLAVDCAHRTALPALLLVRTAREFALAEFDLAYGFPNPQAAGVFKRAGYRELGLMTRWVRVLRHAPYLGRLAEHPRVPARIARPLASPLVAKLAGPILDTTRRALMVPGALRARRRYALEWLPAADERFDALWREARGEYRIAGERGAAFLRWRFPPEPHRSIAALFSREAPHRLRAYAAVEEITADVGTHQVAHVRDLFGHGDAFGPLLDLLLESLWARGDAAISLWYLGGPDLGGLLRARGFEPLASERVVYVGVSRSLEAESALLSDAASWHLVDADEDL
jgi:hypothetical protein